MLCANKIKYYCYLFLFLFYLYIMKRTIWINKPHEGPEEHEFEIVWVKFSDGITRAIYSSSTVPTNYWPGEVYILDILSGAYRRVGSYESQIKNGELVYEFTSV